MTVASTQYAQPSGAPTLITISLNGLLSDTNLAAGRQSNYIDNTADLAIDSLVEGQIMLGTGPTTGKQIEVWFIGSVDGSATGTGVVFSGGLSGVDGTCTPQSKTLLKPAAIIPTNATSNQPYVVGPLSVARAFDGVMPPRWGLFVTHNTGPALNGTASNFYFKYQPVKFSAV